MSEKKKVPILYITLPLLLFAIVFFVLCIRYQAIACGAIILFCIIMINVLATMIEFRTDIVEEEKIEEETGEFIRDIPCEVTCRSYAYCDGLLKIYANGLMYVSNDEEQEVLADFVNYKDLRNIVIEDTKITANFKDSEDTYIISSDKPLRIMNIRKILADEGILNTDKEME